ncbi:MAG TPA: hypothetical protein VIJ88_01490 [Candidatus Paceibacterota bacterium]
MHDEYEPEGFLLDSDLEDEETLEEAEAEAAGEEEDEDEPAEIPAFEEEEE